MARGTAALIYYCSMCDDDFNTKSALKRHQVNHEEAKKVWKCNVCKWDFPDELALENHQIQSGHASKAELMCDNPACQSPGPYSTISAFNKHQKFPSPCSDAFRPRKVRPEENSGFNGPTIELRLPKYDAPVSTTFDEDLATIYSVRVSPVPRTAMSNDDIYCDICQKSFPSMSRYNNHWLACSPPRTSEVKPETNRHPETDDPRNSAPPRNMNESPAPSTAFNGNESGAAVISHSPSAPPQEDQNLKQARPAIQLYQPPKSVPKFLPTSVALAHSRPPPPPPSSPPKTAVTIGASDSAPGGFNCAIQGCGRLFKSNAGLKVHHADVHGFDGEGLDLHGKDSWMLNQAIREQLKQKGLLRGLPIPSGKSKARRARNKENAPTQVPPPPLPARGPQSGAWVPAPVGNQPLPCQPVVSAPSTNRITTNTNVGGLEEIAQANEICSKIMRLNLQSDVLVQHDGKITCSGIGWTRIGVSRQSRLADDFGPLCHLRPVHQAEEYLPPPNAFKKDYQSRYAVSEFEHSAAPTPKKQTLAVVAISCIKILLVDGRQEAVKVAAVDVATGRVLMNHLVYTNPNVPVQDWRTETTGMTSFQDIEAARQDGYKIFKGWQAVRTALWTFVDRDTILVGHNLRADLDSLRMIHGRAVDVVKLIEKAAKGPLSRGQLELDSLCRDLTQLQLISDRSFGRDCLQNAFAARELALWCIKNNDQCIRWAKQKSIDFQRLG